MYFFFPLFLLLVSEESSQMFVPFGPEKVSAIFLSPHLFSPNPPDDSLTVPTAALSQQVLSAESQSSLRHEMKKRWGPTANKTAVINQMCHDRKTDGRMHMRLSDTATAVVPI